MFLFLISTGKNILQKPVGIKSIIKIICPSWPSQENIGALFLIITNGFAVLPLFNDI